VARLFVAVRPPPEVLAGIADLPMPVEPGVRWVPAAQWHVTVRFLGEADLDEVVAALDAAAPALLDRPPVTAAVGPAVARLGRQVICLPVAGLDGLAAAVAEATAELGEPVDPRPFRGHLTLARLRGRGACRLAGHPFSARFVAAELELVRSVLGRSGAEHRVVRALSLAR
jgi:2'-5' RNA ligase